MTEPVVTPTVYTISYIKLITCHCVNYTAKGCLSYHCEGELLGPYAIDLLADGSSLLLGGSYFIGGYATLKILTESSRFFPENLILRKVSWGAEFIKNLPKKYIDSLKKDYSLFSPLYTDFDKVAKKPLGFIKPLVLYAPIPRPILLGCGVALGCGILIYSFYKKKNKNH